MSDKKRIQEVVCRTWYCINADIDWAVTAEEAAELSLDADRPVMFGHMTKEEYKQLDQIEYKTLLKWGAEALKSLV